MFSVVLTGTLPTSRAVHGLLLIDSLKFLSIFTNSFLSTQETPYRIKGFAGRISISSNESNGPHGFTCLEGQSTPSPLAPLYVGSSCRLVQVTARGTGNGTGTSSESSMFMRFGTLVQVQPPAGAP